MPLHLDLEMRFSELSNCMLFMVILNKNRAGHVRPYSICSSNDWATVLHVNIVFKYTSGQPLRVSLMNRHRAPTTKTVIQKPYAPNDKTSFA